jgi:hypothetical protein
LKKNTKKVEKYLVGWKNRRTFATAIQQQG